ncbi:hypothetical protein BJX63DRAFT_442109 [Aspergillus granulosus]|uniref:Uncharacterized protein n=1 Tax=Aspergillus granulosus TaxID=176169 RepID=A0ABR4HI11_9EURO
MSYISTDYPQFLPCWGRLPVEQYLIRYWSHSSSETADDQRKRLIYENIQLDEIPKEWDPTDFGEASSWKPTNADTGPAFTSNRIPTDEEIATILRPWRSDDMRKRAWQIWCGRTSEWYGDIADCLDLNNTELFNFGSDWRRIFAILLKIAGCRVHDPRYDARDINNGVEIEPSVHARPRDRKGKTPKLGENPNVLLEKGGTAARDMLHTASLSWIIIVDKETFETDELARTHYRVYLDGMWMAWEYGGHCGPMIGEGVFGENSLLTSESGRRFSRLTDYLEYDDGVNEDEIVLGRRAVDRRIN